MSRSFSLNARGALYAENTGEVCIFLLTVSHPLLEDEHYFSSDPTTRLAIDPELRYGTVSRGVEYDFLPISVTLPEENEDTPPTIRLQMDNVARVMVRLLRSFSTPATVSIEMVFSSDLDLVEASWPEFDLASAEYTGETVIMDLIIDAMQTEPYPAGRFTPGAFGGLF